MKNNYLVNVETNKSKHKFKIFMELLCVAN